MSIDMFLDSADQQVDAISSQCRTYITGLEDVKTAIAQFALEDSLQGKTYDSAKNYLTTTFIPLANGIILICESLEKAAKSFPKSYRNEVDSISLQEEILRNQINRLTILAQNIENIENALKATPLSPLLKHFSETLQNSKQEVQKQLVKLLSFDPVSGQLFIEVEGLIDNVERGLKEVNSGKSFNASTGTFSTMGLNMDWIKPINQQWEIYAESKEQLDTFEIKVTKTQYGTFYQVLRNGQVDDELSSAYQMAAIKSDIKTLLHLGGEFVLVNDIYRLVNGKDWLSGEEENRAEAAGWLTLSALPVSKLAQIAKELKAGNRALKGVALSEKDLEALSKAGVFKDTSGVGKKAKKASGAKPPKIKGNDVDFKQKSVDKAFGKHGKDFGNYPDGGKASVNAFIDDIKKLIDTGVQKEGTWRGVKGTHVYNQKTRLWAFINEDGTLNTAFKLSDEQFKHLLETGIVK
ncbi:hypothetical protein HB782_07240 [Listeria welshimeri]|nr:hypothetical protein [Listeria welshimeri]